MTIVTLRQNETELSKLIARVEAGEEIVIARGGEPVAKLVSLNTVTSKNPPRQAGALAHLKEKMPSDLFLQPMSDDEIAAWEGKYSFPGDNGQ